MKTYVVLTDEQANTAFKLIDMLLNNTYYNLSPVEDDVYQALQTERYVCDDECKIKLSPSLNSLYDR